MIKGGPKYFARYILVGVANTLIYSGLLLFFLGLEIFSYPVSIAFAFSLAMIFQYMANKYYNRFTKVLREQDEDPALTDAEALDAELSDITSDELGADLPDNASGSPPFRPGQRYPRAWRI